jgi:hypothetical protein
MTTCEWNWCLEFATGEFRGRAFCLKHLAKVELGRKPQDVCRSPGCWGDRLLAPMRAPTVFDGLYCAKHALRR